MNNTMPRIKGFTETENTYSFFALGADYTVTTNDKKTFDVKSFHHYDKSERLAHYRTAKELIESGLMWEEFFKKINMKIDPPELFPEHWEILPE